MKVFMRLTGERENLMNFYGWSTLSTWSPYSYGAILLQKNKYKNCFTKQHLESTPFLQISLK